MICSATQPPQAYGSFAGGLRLDHVEKITRPWLNKV
jgi:hypothetical protein